MQCYLLELGLDGEKVSTFWLPSRVSLAMKWNFSLFRSIQYVSRFWPDGGKGTDDDGWEDDGSFFRGASQ